MPLLEPGGYTGAVRVLRFTSYFTNWHMQSGPRICGGTLTMTRLAERMRSLSTGTARRPLRTLGRFASCMALIAWWAGPADPILGSEKCEPRRIVGAAFPRLAQLARIQGTVTARAQMKPDGSVAAVTILEGHGLLAEVVLGSLAEWRFSRSCATASADSSVLITWKFSLKGNCEMHGRQCKQRFWFDHPDTAHLASEVPGINPGDDCDTT